MKIASLFLMIAINMGAVAPTNLKKVFFIVGPAGSGKTTIAELIQKRNSDQVAHFSVGNLLRIEAQKDTERGRMIKQIVDNAQIVPLGVGMDVVKRALQETSKHIILLDGFPPTFEYAIAFQELAKQDHAIKLIGAIEIFLEEDIAKERVLKRNRTDDVAAVFEKRYKRYVQNAEVLNAWYKEYYTFNSISGDQSLEVIIDSIQAKILKTIALTDE